MAVLKIEKNGRRIIYNDASPFHYITFISVGSRIL